MRFRIFVVLTCIVVGSRTAEAQNPVQSVFGACSAIGTVFSEAQVQVPARFIADSSLSPRPIRADRASPNVVEFIVDTLGAPEQNTVKALRITDSVLVRRVTESLGRWRFSPALASACKVRQLVRTAVRW